MAEYHGRKGGSAMDAKELNWWTWWWIIIIALVILLLFFFRRSEHE